MITLNDRTTTELQELRYTDLMADGSLDVRAGAYVLDSLERRISHSKQSAGAGAQQRGPLGRGLDLVYETLLRGWDRFSSTRLADCLNVLAEIQTLAQIARARLGDLPDPVVGRDPLVRDRILERVGAILDKIVTERDEKTSPQKLARQIAKVAGMTTAEERLLLGQWLATVYGTAARTGIEQIHAALIGQHYSHASEQPTLLYEPTYALLRSLALADEEGLRLSTTWTQLQQDTWKQIANEAGARVWMEITILAGAGGTPISLRKRAVAFEHLRTRWTDIVPQYHANPEETDWGRWPHDSGTARKIRTAIWDTIAEQFGNPQWAIEVALLLYGRRSPYRKSRPRARTEHSQHSQTTISDHSPHSHERRDHLPGGGGSRTTPVPSPQGDKTLRRGRPRIRRATTPLPPFPVIGVELLARPTPASPEEEVGGRRRSYDMSTKTLLTVFSATTLPGSVPIDLWAPLLTSAAHFRDLDPTRQSLAIMLLLCPGIFLRPRAVGALRLHCGSGRCPDDTDGRYLLDLEQGILHCPAEPELLAELAKESAGQDHQPTYWPLVLPAELIGWFRLHLARVRAMGVSVNMGDAALYIQPIPGARPRPATGHDLALYFASRQTVGRKPLPDNLLAHAEMLTYQQGSPVCPGLLCHLSGTHHPRYDAIVPYQRPRHATRRDAARQLCSAVAAEVVARFADAPPILARFADMGARLTTWIGEGQSAGEAVTHLALDERCGSPTVPELSTIAHAWHTALHATEDGNEFALKGALTTIAEITTGLRRDDLRYCRPTDLSRDADQNLWLRASRKGAGDENRRWAHIPIVGILADLLSAAERYPSGGTLDAAPPFDLDAPIVRATGGRHAISTFILDHYAEIGWGPHEWIVGQWVLGHEIEENPVLRDDETTYSTLHQIWASLLNRYTRALETESNDGSR